MTRSLSFALAVAVAACGYRGSPSQPLTPQVKSVSVGPAMPPMSVGQTAQLTATAYDTQGQVITGLTVNWQSSDQTTVTVDKNGLINAAATGTAKISATISGATGTLDVSVAGP